MVEIVRFCVHNAKNVIWVNLNIVQGTIVNDNFEVIVFVNTDNGWHARDY